jgi:hypothetical protein
MSFRHNVEREWPLVDSVQDQCRLMNAICAGTVTLRIMKLCKQLEISEREGWSLYGLQVVRQIMEQGILWDRLFEILLVMNREYIRDVTQHFRCLNENHQRTLDFMDNLRQAPEFPEYRLVMCYLSCCE